MTLLETLRLMLGKSGHPNLELRPTMVLLAIRESQWAALSISLS